MIEEILPHGTRRELRYERLDFDEPPIFVEEHFVWVDPVKKVDYDLDEDLAELARQIAEDDRRGQGRSLEEAARRIEIAETFEGFCGPCGGFRAHKLGCPRRKKR